MINKAINIQLVPRLKPHEYNTNIHLPGKPLQFNQCLSLSLSLSLDLHIYHHPKAPQMVRIPVSLSLSLSLKMVFESDNSVCTVYM